MDQDRLIEAIYEAAIVPEYWPRVLDGVAASGGGVFAAMFALAGTVQRHVTSNGGAEAIDRYIAEGWPARTDRSERVFRAQHAGFVTDLDVYTPAEIAREPVYTEFLHPRGWGWGTATGIVVPGGDRIVFAVEGRHADGPTAPAAVARLDRLRPHLARAAALTAQVQLDRARSVAAAFGWIGVPAAIVGARGQAVAMNAACEGLLGRVVLDGRTLGLAEARANRLFTAAIEALREAAGDAAGGARSIPIRADEGREACVCHVLPVLRGAADVLGTNLAIVLFTFVDTARAPDAGVLQGLFDLTPAEARVGRQITQAKSVAQIAQALRLSRETVRSHLKQVLAKTGTRRQAELAALLAGLDLPLRAG